MKKQIILTAVFSGGVVIGAQAGLIQNGSFESPSYSQFHVVNPGDRIFWGTDPDNWSGDSEIIISDNFPSVDIPNPQSGMQYVQISTGYTPLSQQFNVSSPGNYVLSWYDSGMTGWDKTTYSVSLGTKSGNYSVYFPGNPHTDATWTIHDINVTLSSGINTLTFTDTGNSIGSVVFLDNVDITASPVPEPSTYLAGLSALGMFGLFRFRYQS